MFRGRFLRHSAGYSRLGLWGRNRSALHSWMLCGSRLLRHWQAGCVIAVDRAVANPCRPTIYVSVQLARTECVEPAPLVLSSSLLLPHYANPDPWCPLARVKWREDAGMVLFLVGNGPGRVASPVGMGAVELLRWLHLCLLVLLGILPASRRPRPAVQNPAGSGHGYSGNVLCEW